MEQHSRQNSRNLRFGLLLAVTLLCVGGLGIASHELNPLWGWFASFLFLLFFPIFWGEPRVRLLREHGVVLLSRPWAPYVGVSCVVFAGLWPISVGTIPVSQDHSIHYFATHILVNDLIPKGHLFGWTDRISSGLPFGDVYGTMVYLVTGGLNLLSLGWIPLSVSYSFGILLVWWIPAMAIVAWARRLCIGFLPAMIAGSFFVLDAGFGREGGWSYSMYHGVWPQLLATGVWLWAMLAIVRLIERHTWRRFGATILLVGLALWAHPMNAINLPASSILLVLWLMLYRKPSSAKLQQGGLWAICALFLGALIGLVWLVRMVVASPYLGEFTAYWEPLAQLMDRMLRGELFRHQYVFVGLLAILGVVQVLLQKRRLGLFVLVMCSGFLFVGSMELLSLFDLGVHPAHKLFMYRRLSVSIKPFWFIFSGIGAAMCWGAFKSLSRSEGVSLPRTAKWLLVLFLAPLFWSVLKAIPKQVRSPVGRVLTLKGASLHVSIRQLNQVMDLERRRTPERRLRVIHWLRRGGGYTLFGSANAGDVFLPISTPPCHAFIWSNAKRNYKVLKWMGATHLLASRAQSRKDLTLLVRAGRFFLYRIESQESRYPVKLLGPGTLQVLSWKDMQRKIKLKGVTKDSRLIVGLPPYHKWRVRQGSQSRPLELYPHKGYRFSQVRHLTDGILTLSYESQTVELIFGGLGGLVLVFALFCFGLGGRELPVFLSAAAGRWLSYGANVIIVGGFVGLAALLVLSQRYALQSEYAGSTFPRVLSVLHRDGLISFKHHPKNYCVRPFVRSPRPGCHESEIRPYLASGPKRRNRRSDRPRVVPGTEKFVAKRPSLSIRSWYRIPSCLYFRIPNRGQAIFRFKLPPKTRLLRGRFHWAHTRMKRIIVVGSQFYNIKTRRQFSIKIPPGVHDVKVLSLNEGRKRRACLELVALGK